jgi:hypothetical protein
MVTRFRENMEPARRQDHDGCGFHLPGHHNGGRSAAATRRTSGVGGRGHYQRSSLLLACAYSQRVKESSCRRKPSGKHKTIWQIVDRCSISAASRHLGNSRHGLVQRR